MTTYRVYAGGSYLRKFSTKKAAIGYGTGVVANSHPNIGNVTVTRHTADDIAERETLVASLGCPA